MLSEGIIHECIIRLLCLASDEEISLECFCVLITITGKLLDKSEAKRRMDQYFQRISDIIKKKKLSLRMKFRLQGVQDLRKVWHNYSCHSSCRPQSYDNPVPTCCYKVVTTLKIHCHSYMY